MTARPPQRLAMRWVLGLLVVTLVARGAMVFATPHLPLTADAADYVRHAQSIAAGHGYPPTAVAGHGGTALRPPGFPYFLGAVWAAGGHVTAARDVQALVGTMVVALTGALAALVGGARLGLAALALAAVYPPWVIGGTALLSEPLFAVLELAAVLALVWHLRSGALRYAAAAGLCGGLAVLTRPNGALLLAVLAGAAVAGRRAVAVTRDPPPRRWVAAIALAATALLVIAPWTVRNAIVFQALIPVSTNGGYTLAGTYNDASRTDPRFPAAWRPVNLDASDRALLARASGMTEPQVNDLLGSAARRYIREHPGYVIEVAWRNALRLLGLGGRDFHRLAAVSEVGVGSRWSDAEQYGFLPFALLAVAGAFTMTARRIPRWLWLVPAAMATVVLVLATQRFRAPIDPFVILLAACAVIAPLEGAGTAPWPLSRRRAASPRR